MGLGIEEGTAALFPARMVAGGRGPTGEMGDDVGAHLLVARIRVGVAGGGLAAEELMARSRSFRRIWRS